MADLKKEIEKRRTFAIISHPDAGKTTLTQSIAKGLGITKTVSSPTFTICKIYHGRLPLYHFDAYRLEGSDEELGFEEMIEGDGLAVIEWPQYIESMIPEDVLNISIHLTLTFYFLLISYSLFLLYFP